MREPRDLFQVDLTVQPTAELSVPRLWVRRLVIWPESGAVTLRDIALRPGLNIVWTPDTDEIGHGGGKTLFCRLLRYCLGESRYAADEQRERIGNLFPDGMVGAEVMLDGQCWAVIRPLGMRRRHLAIPDGDLDELVSSDQAHTGIEPLIHAIESTILTPELNPLIPGHRQEHTTWLVALAWLARDQECRFDHALDWRSTASDSGSPARSLSQREKRDAVRAFLRAISTDEHDLRIELARLEDEKRQIEQEVSHRHWEIEQLRQRLATELGVEQLLASTALAPSVFRQAAMERLEKTPSPPTGRGPSRLQTARIDCDAARENFNKIRSEFSAVDRTIPLLKELIGQLEGSYPVLQVRKLNAEDYPCPICEVPIDRVLAEGCKLSHKLPNLQECEERLSDNRRDWQDQSERLEKAKNELARLKQAGTLAEQELEKKTRRLADLEETAGTQVASWYASQKLVDEVERLESLLKQQEHTGQEEYSNRIEQARNRLSDLINQQAKALTMLNEKFDPLIRALVGCDAKGTVRLTREGLTLTVQMGGDRSTSAIDSLKVVAFDLAALCLSIEGKTQVPAFLIHDSPREADLGLPLYHRLFQQVYSLEKINANPLFQYIVTTTTSPPEVLAREPWMRLKISGSPAKERLMRADL